MSFWMKAVPISGVAAYFAGGFVMGMVMCEGCNQTIVHNTLGRLFMGVIWSIMSALTLGFPPSNFVDGKPAINCWPYIITSWIVFMVFCVAWSRFRRTTNLPISSN